MRKNVVRINNYNGIIAYFLSLFAGILIAVTSTFAQNKEYTIAAIIIGIIISIISILIIVFHLKRQTIISTKEITSSVDKQTTKSLEITKLKRILVYKIERGGGYVGRIVFDDGTFNEYDYTYPTVLFSTDSRRSNSWISVDYSLAKLKTLKRTLSNVPFVEFRTDYSPWKK